jgi:hypothetical protein
MERELRWNDFEDCVQFVAARGLDADYSCLSLIAARASNELPTSVTSMRFAQKDIHGNASFNPSINRDISGFDNDVLDL